MNIHRTLLAAIILLFSASCVWAEKIMLVVTRTNPEFKLAAESFQKAWVGEIEIVNMEDDFTRGDLIRETVFNASPDGIVVLGLEALYLFKSMPKDIPLAYTLVDRPVDFLEGESSVLVSRIPVADRVAGLKILLPEARTVGLCYNPHFSGDDLDAIRDAVAAQGLVLHAIAVENHREILKSLKKLSSGHVDVLWSAYDNTTSQLMAVRVMIQHARKQKIPFIGLNVYHVKAGAFAAFAPDYSDLGAQSAEIIRGRITNPKARGQVITPRKTVCYVNGETQKAVGIDRLPETLNIVVFR